MARKAVIFDLFGTLVEAMRYKQYQEMLAGMAAVFNAPHAALNRTRECTSGVASKSCVYAPPSPGETPHSADVG